MRKSFLLGGILCAALCLSVATLSFAKEDAPKGKSKAAEPANTKCPITGDDVDASAPTTKYKGKTIGFCCKDCPAKFAKLKAAEKDEKVKAVLTEGSDDKKTDDKKDTEKKPAKGKEVAATAGKAVNKNCVVETDHGIDTSVKTVSYKGKTYGFCCEDCIKKFNSDPDSFALAK